MKLIAIQDYQRFLALFPITLPEGAVLESFRSAYHPWGASWNVRTANDIALRFLRDNQIRFAVYEENK